jgi:hypothetical protein
MYKSSLRHIHDPVLSSLKMKGIRLLCFTRSDWSCLPQFPLKCRSTAAAKYESADWDSFMVCALWCPTTLLGILEQYVSGTMDRLMSTMSMACSFPCYISRRFLSLGTTKVYCFCYRSHWCRGLGTVNREWIWDDPYDTRNFAVNQQIIVQAMQHSFFKLKMDTLSTFFNL